MHPLILRPGKPVRTMGLEPVTRFVGTEAALGLDQD